MGETEALQHELSISRQELAVSQKQRAKLDETSHAEIEGLQACMHARMCMRARAHARAHEHACMRAHIRVCMHGAEAAGGGSVHVAARMRLSVV